MGMNLADGGVHHGLVHMRILGNAIEYRFENTMFDPMAEPLEHRVPHFSKTSGQKLLADPAMGILGRCSGALLWFGRSGSGALGRCSWGAAGSADPHSASKNNRPSLPVRPEAVFLPSAFLPRQCGAINAHYASVKIILVIGNAIVSQLESEII